MYYVTPDLPRFERKISSQFGEDGVILEIARCLNIDRGSFFEFGIGPAYLAPPSDPLEGNFVYIKTLGWQGVFLDGGDHPIEHEVRKEIITAININELYRKHSLPEELDMMSIDVDGQEFWIWLALDYHPKVMIIEYNGAIDAITSVTMPFMPGHIWNGLNNNGASLLALKKLGLSKGYILVWANGVNAAFVRSDLVSNKDDFRYEQIYKQWVLHPEDPNAIFVQV